MAGSVFTPHPLGNKELAGLNVVGSDEDDSKIAYQEKRWLFVFAFANRMVFICDNWKEQMVITTNKLSKLLDNGEAYRCL